MTKNIFLILLLTLTLSTVSFGQKRAALTDSEIEKSLDECAYGGTEYTLDQSEHKQEFKIPKCGGTLEVKQSQNGSQKIPQVILRDVSKCSYLTLGVNGNYKPKSVSKTYSMNAQGSGQSYGGSYVIKDEQINYNGSGYKDNNVRIVLHSKSGKTCAQVRVFLGNVY